ncbi:MAG: hypothetical protein E6I19_05840 [Chloroflexi bacterium]|nr:MAG: hypothetical protein E6I19_05840 [Chloroflexota bacterium]
MRGGRQRRRDRARAPRVTSAADVTTRIPPLDVDIASIAPAGARFEDGEIARIVVDRPTDNVNAIDPPLIAALGRAVADAREARPRGLVIVSAKPDQFVAGADLTMLANRPSAAQLSQGSREIQRIFSDLAALPFPTVAAINGSALGGGYELALACDWRIAADAPSVRIGLPEVSLGLLPGAGGTQRLPRLIGLPRALDQILNARRSNARRALRAGLVDEVVHPAALERAALDRARKGEKRKVQGGASLVDRAATWLAPARAFALRQARAGVLAETKGHYPAPLKALEAIAIGLADGMDAGLVAEARLFGELATSDVSRNLIALFLLGLAQRRAAYEGLPRGEAPSDIAIVGAGLMGSGIAQSAAMGGATVRLRDVDTAAVSRGLDAVRKLTTDAARKRVIERRESTRVISRVSGTTDYSGFRRADLVIEAVFEDIAVKRNVIKELEDAVREDAVIATNTSALPIWSRSCGPSRPILGRSPASSPRRRPWGRPRSSCATRPASTPRASSASCWRRPWRCSRRARASRTSTAPWSRTAGRSGHSRSRTRSDWSSRGMSARPWPRRAASRPARARCSASPTPACRASATGAASTATKVRSARRTPTCTRSSG